MRHRGYRCVGRTKITCQRWCEWHESEFHRRVVLPHPSLSIQPPPLVKPRSGGLAAAETHTIRNEIGKRLSSWPDMHAPFPDKPSMGAVRLHRTSPFAHTPRHFFFPMTTLNVDITPAHASHSKEQVALPPRAAKIFEKWNSQPNGNPVPQTPSEQGTYVWTHATHANRISFTHFQSRMGRE